MTANLCLGCGFLPIDCVCDAIPYAQPGCMGQTYDNLEDEHLHFLWSAIRYHLDNKFIDMACLQLHVLIADCESKIDILKETVEGLNADSNQA